MLGATAKRTTTKAWEMGDRERARSWADGLSEERVHCAEEWRDFDAETIAMSAEDSEKTLAVMKSVLELMRLHRASLLRMLQRGAIFEDRRL